MMIALSVGCVQFDHDLKDQLQQAQSATLPGAIINEVKIIGDLGDSAGDFIQIIGSNLGRVNGGFLNGPGINQQLFVDSRSETQANLIASSPINFTTELIYNLVISTADAQSSALPITITIPNNSITEPLITDGSIRPDLDLGAPLALAINDGDVLEWSSTNNRWEPTTNARFSRMLLLSNERGYNPYSKGLKHILELNPIMTQENQTNLALLANDAKRAFSEALEGEQEAKGIDTNLILGSLINAIKELHLKLESKQTNQKALQAKIISLRNQNMQLANEKDQLKAQIDDIHARLQEIEDR